MTQLELEEEFSQFIEFGKVFDRKTRLYLVQYLNAKIFKKPLPEESTANPYFRYFRKALDDLLGNKVVFKIMKQNETLRIELMHDLFKWIRNTDKKITENNPFYEEKERLEAWSHKPTFLWKERWYVLTNFLKNEYLPEQLDVSFYVMKFKEQMPDAPSNLEEQKIVDQQAQKLEVELVINDLLAQWDALLTTKLLQYQEEEVQQEHEGFEQLMEAKVNEYVKLEQIITPIATEAGRYWDMSRGLWKDMSFDILDQYNKLLLHEKSIQELADLLGKMREAEIELEEETYENVVVKKEWVTDAHLKDEINGIHGGNNLNHIVPSETVLLSDESTAPAFYQKYADQSLLSFRYEGKKLVTSDKVTYFTRQKQKKKEKGPFILCIDTSGSMYGKPSQIAKVLCFAIMKMAAKENRKCYLISFSIGIKTINLSDMANSMDKIVEFLSMSFDGGTDVTPALSQALDMLQTNEYREADVLMVSDFVMFEIRKEILERITREQNKDTHFHSLTIGNRANPEVLEAFDNCWFYDQNDGKVVRQLLKDLNTLKEG